MRKNWVEIGVFHDFLCFFFFVHDKHGAFSHLHKIFQVFFFLFSINSINDLGSDLIVFIWILICPSDIVHCSLFEPQFDVKVNNCWNSCWELFRINFVNVWHCGEMGLNNICEIRAFSFKMTILNCKIILINRDYLSFTFANCIFKFHPKNSVQCNTSKHTNYY